MIPALVLGLVVVDGLLLLEEVPALVLAFILLHPRFPGIVIFF